MRLRKRSAYVGFSAIGMSAALAGCGPERAPDAKDVSLYRSVAECSAERGQKDCDAGWTAAQDEHRKDAPKFADRAACEADWGEGKCEEARNPGGGSFFMPALMGFMMGRALSGGPTTGVGPQGCPPGQPNCAQGGARGVYVGSGGGLYSGRDRIGDAAARGGTYELPRTVAVSEGPGGRLSPGVTRGGFGRSAGIHGFGRGGGG
jgi:uncharacterized protein YgiB involved in biofilm formation